MRLVVLPWSSLRPLLHDAYISVLGAYGPSALETLGRAADPAMRIQFLSPPTGRESAQCF